MSHSERSTEKINLEAIAADSDTEVSIIDDAFRTVSYGLGNIQKELKPGIYKVEFRAGDSAHTEYAILKPGSEPVTIQGPLLEFSSPAPMAVSKTGDQIHMDTARRVSREPCESLGSGSGMFIFARDPSAAPGPRKNPARGLSLHDLSGKRLMMVEDDCEFSVEDQWSGMTLLLDPGLYRLRVRTDVVGSLEQIVVACQGWQTQVFMFQRTFRRGDESRRRADLFNASVMMTNLEQAPDQMQGFDPEEKGLRILEMARLGLVEHRQAISPKHLDMMLGDKFENPMLGIFGGYLLLLDREVDVFRLERLVENLRRLVGDHPDVMALVLKLALLKGESLDGVAPFVAPPMLRSSWEIMVEASAQKPDLVPPGSLTARISQAIWTGGAWLTWRANDLAPAAEIEQVDVDTLVGTVQQRAAQLSDASWVRKFEEKQSLTNLERGVLRILSNAAYEVQKADLTLESDARHLEFSAQPEELLSAEDMVKTLGVPSTSIGQTASDLLEKLDREL